MKQTLNQKRQTRKKRLLSKRADYEALRAEWYGRLKDEGFRDIEKRDALIQAHSSYFIERHAPVEFENRLDYYLMCESFLNSYGFDSRLDLEVWRLHTDGWVPDKIVPQLKTIGMPANRMTVYNIISRLERVMKLGIFFD